MLAHHVISQQLFLLTRNDLARVYVDYTGSSISKRGLCFGRSLVAWAFLQWCHSLAFTSVERFVEQLLVTGGLLYGFPERQRLDWLIGTTAQGVMLLRHALEFGPGCPMTIRVYKILLTNFSAYFSVLQAYDCLRDKLTGRPTKVAFLPKTFKEVGPIEEIGQIC
jgi:hypothetical protein